jgi:hypothetical protein
MKPFISRRTFCAGTALVPAATLLLPGCGGGGTTVVSEQPGSGPLRAFATSTEAPARWADIAMRAAALAPVPGLPPHFEARSFSMGFLAAHDALNAIRPVYASYLTPLLAPGANADAAVAAAVHDVLVHEMPFAQALLDSEYAAALGAVRGAGSKPQGIAVGQASAAAMIAARANDGLASVEGPFVEGTTPGAYRFTPPFDFAAEVHWGDAMRPFGIARAVDFRVAAPYSVTDAAYTADYNEVKALGAAVGSTRTADQSELGRFWLESTVDAWLQIALQVAAQRGMAGWPLMRALALIAVAQVDAYTACIESKYLYHFWRPITAIRLGDSDGNPATIGDAACGVVRSDLPTDPRLPVRSLGIGGCGRRGAGADLRQRRGRLHAPERHAAGTDAQLHVVLAGAGRDRFVAHLRRVSLSACRQRRHRARARGRCGGDGIAVAAAELNRAARLLKARGARCGCDPPQAPPHIGLNFASCATLTARRTKRAFE